MTARRRLALALAATVCACAVVAGPAVAFTPAAGRAAADRVAAGWARHQQPNGAFTDYVSGRPTYGYAAVMIGYGMLRAGVRRHDDRLIAGGFRAVDAGLGRDLARRGVFDALANATAYSFARRNLAGDPRFAALRGRWERYLQSIQKPYIRSAALRACTADPRCFHNHEVVAAFGDLQLLNTGLRSQVPGAKLADPAGLRASALQVLTAQIPEALGRSGRATRGDPRTGLGLLSDTGAWPLAYHAFSAAMLAGGVSDLGRAAPAGVRKSALASAHTIAALMAPDGDVTYLGRRQQQAWALASAVYAAAVVERLPGQDSRARGQMRAVADRAFARLTRVNRFGPGGIGAVPRPLSPRTGYHGVDANEVVPAALTIFLLNLASDEPTAATAIPRPRPAPLPADLDGSFVEPDQAGFAAVRHGDLWYAVHRRNAGSDLRYDFGLIALKRRDARGGWHDLVRPRPNTRGAEWDSAGPVILSGGTRYLPYGERIEVRPGGVVLVHGGYRAQKAGPWLRRGVTFRFAPVRGGVAMSFPLRAGDAARVVTFLPVRSARLFRGGVVGDRVSTESLSLRPRAVRFGRGYASCCDAHLVAATMSLRPVRDQTVVYTVRARSGHRGPGVSATVLADRHAPARSDRVPLIAGVGALLALFAFAFAATRLRRRAPRRR